LGHGAFDVPHPCAVIAIVTVKRPRKITPELAKALLDALHDCKHNPPHYRTGGGIAPIADDDPRHVSALAVQVVAGMKESVQFVLADGVRINGDLIASIDVDAQAPNDVAASSAEESARKGLRRAFAEAVLGRWPKESPNDLTDASCLMVRHGPQRDEDNTWATWIGVLTRGGSWAIPISASPMSRTWQPRAVASVADPALDGRVVFEFYR
jgi:hypothetical protein